MGWGYLDPFWVFKTLPCPPEQMFLPLDQSARRGPKGDLGDARLTLVHSWIFPWDRHGPGSKDNGHLIEDTGHLGVGHMAPNVSVVVLNKFYKNACVRFALDLMSRSPIRRQSDMAM